MAEMISTEDIVNVKRDLNDIGECVNGNETGVVTPRYGVPYKSIPLVSAEFNEKTIAAQNKINEWNAAIALITQQGGVPALAVSDASGKTQQEINNVSVKNGDYAPVLAERSIRLDFDYPKGALRYGLNDLVRLDDYKNHFRGLSNPDSWASENIGIGSVAFGRNNCAYSYLTMALGHDSITYGVASFAGGAGACTGNPDVPNDGANYGYCSFAYGKDNMAMGRISNAMGHESEAHSRYSSVDGYRCIAGPALATHPDGIVSEGAAARAHGYESEAYGNFSFAYGALLRAYNGSQVIGKGNYNVGTPLTVSKGGLGLGCGVDIPTIYCAPGNGVNGAGARVGFNTENPISRYDFRMGRSDTVTHIIESTEDGAAVAFEVKGLLGNGTLGSLHNLVITHSNAGQAFGDATYYLNGSSYLRVDETRKASFTSGVETGAAGLSVGGNRVVGGQLAAIANSSGTAADNQRAINEILAALRSHGLIAT